MSNKILILILVLNANCRIICFHRSMIHLILQNIYSINLSTHGQINILLIRLCPIENQRHRSIWILQCTLIWRRIKNLLRKKFFFCKLMVNEYLIIFICKFVFENLAFHIIYLLINICRWCFRNDFKWNRVKSHVELTVTHIILYLTLGDISSFNERQDWISFGT